MKTHNGRLHQRFHVAQRLVCALLVIGVVFTLPGTALACGFHTHVYVAQLATIDIHKNGLR